MRIALIEDNTTLANAIAYRLQDRGHAVDILATGIEGEAYIEREGADLIILDLNLPGKDGLTILKNIRGNNTGTPTLLLTARATTADRIAGLDLGADDYLTKPFDMDELEARIRALLRRKNLSYEEKETLGPLEFDRAGMRVQIEGKPFELPRRELAVLSCLLENKGRIVLKNTLLDHVYGIAADIEVNAIEPHISRLRRRLSQYDIKIKVVRGLGYLIETG